MCSKNNLLLNRQYLCTDSCKNISIYKFVSEYVAFSYIIALQLYVHLIVGLEFYFCLLLSKKIQQPLKTVGYINSENVPLNVRFELPAFAINNSFYILCYDNYIKEGGLTRELSSNSKTTFYSCTFFLQPRPLPEGAHNCRLLAAVCIVFYRTGRVTADNSIVYGFLCLATR